MLISITKQIFFLFTQKTLSKIGFHDKKYLPTFIKFNGVKENNKIPTEL